MSRRAFLLAAALLLAACGEQAFKATDITGAEFGRDFALADPSGQVRSLADFKGKAVLVFFGFTQCPDVCPTTLAKLREVKQALGKDGDRVQVIFITVDPERDTPELLKAYTAAFDPAFLGLRPTLEQLPVLAKSFKIFYQKVPGKAPGTYSMDHSAMSYVYDPQGRLRLAVAHNADVATIVADLKKLLG